MPRRRVISRGRQRGMREQSASDQATITIDSDFSQFWKPEVKGSAGLVSSQASLGFRWLTSVCPSFCACLCPNLIL